MFPNTKSTCAFTKTGYIATAQNYNFLSSDINTWRRLRQRQELLQQVLIVLKSVLLIYCRHNYDTSLFSDLIWHSRIVCWKKVFSMCLVPSAIKIVICPFKWSWTNVQSSFTDWIRKKIPLTFLRKDTNPCNKTSCIPQICDGFDLFSNF